MPSTSRSAKVRGSKDLSSLPTSPPILVCAPRAPLRPPSRRVFRLSRSGSRGKHHHRAAEVRATLEAVAAITLCGGGDGSPPRSTCLRLAPRAVPAPDRASREPVGVGSHPPPPLALTTRSHLPVLPTSSLSLSLPPPPSPPPPRPPSPLKTWSIDSSPPSRRTASTTPRTAHSTFRWRAR